MLRARIITAVVLLVLFSLDLFLASESVFALVLSLLVAACAWEWSRLSGIRGEHAQTGYAIVVSLVTLFCLHGVQEPDTIRWVLLVGLVYWVAALIELYLHPKREPIVEPSVLLMARGAVALIITAIAMQYLRSTAEGSSALLLLYAFAVVWVMDIGAFFSGRRFGSRKLAPLVSPGKSWEGVWGGLVASGVLLAGCLLLADWPAQELWPLVIATLLSAVASVVGDLHESRLKRAAGLKDSSRMLPGHGGLLDRVDGVMGALPLFAFVWAWS